MNPQTEMKSDNSDIGVLGVFSMALIVIVGALFASGHPVMGTIALVFSSGVIVTFLGACGLLDWIPPTVDLFKKVISK